MKHGIKLRRPRKVADSDVQEMQLAASIALEEVVRGENVAFSKMTPAQRRIAIAEDVLLWLDTGRLRAENMTYLAVNTDGETLGKTINGYSCEACALGALFVAAAERRLCDVDRATNGGTYGNPDTMHELLRPYFSLAQLKLIECAFELFEYDDGEGRIDERVPDDMFEDIDQSDDFTSTLVEDAVWFGERYENGAPRLRAIMLNVIKHRGTFVP